MIREAQMRDCKAMCAIYLPYVRDTAVSFEEILPTENTFIHKIETLCPKYPFLVWEEDGQVAAYAYASAFRERAAYRYGAELSVYVADAFQGRGIGKRLYEKLLEELALRGYLTAYGVVTLPNKKSEGLHLGLGFTKAGLLKNAGYKLGGWHDVGIFEKALGEYAAKPRTI
jgi:Sortase and related acyltransferases